MLCFVYIIDRLPRYRRYRRRHPTKYSYITFLTGTHKFEQNVKEGISILMKYVICSATFELGSVDNRPKSILVPLIVENNIRVIQ